MAKLTSAARYNLPVNAGVAGNHSSLVPSTSNTLADHGQYDDAMDDVQYRIDPNLSGTTETAQLHDPMAGSLSGWEENDCYRDFFLEGQVAESRVYGEDFDPDFDSNGGIPSPMPARTFGYTPSRAFDIGPVVTRRL